MTVKTQYCEIEIAAPQSRPVFFKPIGRALRGRVDLSASQSDRDKSVRQVWPEVIPGQRICFDFATGDRFIAEPLHREEFAELRAKITAKHKALPKKRDNCGSESLVTWVYHCHRLVSAGLARIVEGELPPWESFGEDPKRRFISPETKSDAAKMTTMLEHMTVSLDANTEMLRALTERIAGKSAAK